MTDNPSYEIFDELGQGENTVVCRGYDLDLGREVAIKQLNAQSRQDERRVARFLKEASFLAQFEHENILRIYSVDKDRGWIVMELMKGTLARQVADQPMAPDAVRSVLRQILGALEFLHQKEKVHGAVRPSNILINDQGTAKLSDFEATDADGELRAPVGSKKHLAPELIRPEFGPLGPPLDLYCLGFTALELLTGPKFESLFPGTGTGAIDADVAWLRWHSSEETLAPVRQLCPQVPEDLALVIDKLLAKQVADRPQSAKEVLNLLSDQAFIPIVVPAAAEQPSSSAATPPQPAAQVREGNRPVKSAPVTTGKEKKRAGAGTPVAAKSTKDKVNDFLGKPYVLWPLCAGMLLAALMIGLHFQKGDRVAIDPELIGPPMARVLLEIQPGPEDAHVLIDGEAQRPAPDGRYELSPGDHELRVTKEGFVEHRQLLEIPAAVETMEFTIALQALPASVEVAKLRLNVLPSDAQVSINGNEHQLGQEQPLTLDPGRYDLVIRKQGFEEYRESITVEPGHHEYTVTLRALPVEPAMARVRIDVLPTADDTRILIDGQEARPDAEGRYVLQPGSHQLRVEKEGFETHLQTLSAQPGNSDLEIALLATPQPREEALVKVDLTISPPPERWGAGDRDTADLPSPTISEDNMLVAFEHSKDSPLTVSASREGFQSVERSITWQELVDSEFHVNILLEPIEKPALENELDLTDPLETLFVNAEEIAARNREKTEQLANQFTGEAQLVIDAGGFLEQVNDVSLSPDGVLVAAAGEKVVRIWNVETGQLLATLRGDRSRTSYGDCHAVSFSPDGSTLLVGVNDYEQHGSIREYSLANLAEIQRLIPGHSAPCRELAFSVAGDRRLSADADGNVLIADTATDQVVATFKAAQADQPILDVITFPAAGNDVIFALDYGGPKLFSADGTPLGPQDDIPDSLRGWFADVFDKKIDYPFGSTQDPRVLAFALDRGRWAAAGVARQAGRNRFWAAVYAARQPANAASNAKPLQVYSGHRWSITCLDLGRRHNLAVTGDKFGEVHVWDQQTGELVRKFTPQGTPIYEVAFDENSNRIAFGTRAYLADEWSRNHYGAATRVLDLHQRAILPISAADSLQLNDEQPQIGDVAIDLSRAREEARITLELKHRGDVVSSYRLSSGRNPTVYSLIPQPKLDVQIPVVFGDNEGVLAVWDTATDKLRRAFIGHDSLVSGISFSRNGKLMASSSSDRTIRIWSLEDYVPTGSFDFRFQNTSVVELKPGSSSVAAGVRVGDEVVSLDGMSMSEMYNQMLAGNFDYRPGQVVPVEMRRDGQVYTYDMTMAEGYDFVEPTLSCFIGDDEQWIVWSPRGYYDAAPGADQLIGWHINRGPARSATFHKVHQFRDELYRPDVIDLILEGYDVTEAVRRADEARQQEGEARDLREPREIAAVHPPEVQILRPADGLESSQAAVRLTARINSPNGLPIEEATLLQNGIVVKVFQPTDLAADGFEIEHQVQLEPGVNRFEVIAANKKATSSMVGVEVTYTAAPKAARQGDAHVLAIGISTYEASAHGLERLPNAALDARRFAQTVRTHENGKIYDNVNLKLLTDDDATRTNILDGFQWLVDQAKPKDSVMVFFAGHAFVDTQDNFYLATHEADIERPRATTVAWRQFTDMLHEDLPGCRRLVFLDVRPTKGGIRPGMRNPLLDLAAPELGTIFFASNTLQQVNPSASDAENSPFVQAIVDTLRDKKSDRMPTPPDQLINTLELAYSIKKRVQESSAGRQLPTFFAATQQRRDNLLELLNQ